MDSDSFSRLKGRMRLGLGQDVSGQAVAADMRAMPHLLIAGATGAGKSVCVNSVISALLLQNTPDTLRMMMVDPKRVELTQYNGIPHLLAPVIVDVDRVVPTMRWVVREMDSRYRRFANVGARNIDDFNQRVRTLDEESPIPYIAVLIDELADMMMQAPDEAERVICRLAQMARATGIHLIIATQRPSVDVVTGLIKANFPARIAFAVASAVDSRVILDTPGCRASAGAGRYALHAAGRQPAAALAGGMGLGRGDRAPDQVLDLGGGPGPDADPGDAVRRRSGDRRRGHTATALPDIRPADLDGL